MAERVIIGSSDGLLKISASGNNAGSAAFDELLFNGNLRSLRTLDTGNLFILAPAIGTSRFSTVPFGFTAAAPLLALVVRKKATKYNLPWLHAREWAAQQFINDGWFYGTNSSVLYIGHVDVTSGFTFHYAIFDQAVYT